MEKIKIFFDHMNDRLVFADEDSVSKYANLEDKILLIYDEKVIDATNFAKQHPGGRITLEDHIGYDITEIFFLP